jgi:hypothetical protein
MKETAFGTIALADGVAHILGALRHKLLLHVFGPIVEEPAFGAE